MNRKCLRLCCSFASILFLCALSSSCVRERVVQKIVTAEPPTQDVQPCTQIVLSTNAPQVQPKFCYARPKDEIEWSAGVLDFTVDFDDSPFESGKKHIDKSSGKQKVKAHNKVRLYLYAAAIGSTTLDPNIIIMP